MRQIAAAISKEDVVRIGEHKGQHGWRIKIPPIHKPIIVVAHKGAVQQGQAIAVGIHIDAVRHC